MKVDVCVVGGGSGGLTAALAAAREGADVVLLEKQAVLGGTGVAGLVCIWGGTQAESIAREIYDKLQQQGKAGIARRFGKVPYHCWTIDPTLPYKNTLAAKKNRVVYDPVAFSATILEMLRSHGVKVLLDTPFVSATAEGKRVRSVEAVSADGTRIRIQAKVFVDATGDVYLCRALGCATRIGKSLNGVTLCYRVTKKGEEAADVLNAKPFKRTSCNHQLPNGDRIINMLPTLIGDELLTLGYDQAMAKCQKLVRRHWAWLRKGPGEWKDYHFAETATLLGVREGYRIVAEYTLSAADLQLGFDEQPHSDMIALASHGVDVHGARKAVKHVRVKPYGIPYRCLIPKGWENLLVACRGAGFDRVAASSVRLQRTMMWLGHSAGIAAAQAAKSDLPVGKVDVSQIIRKVGMTTEDVHRMLGKNTGSATKKRAAVEGKLRHEFLCTDNGQGKVLKFNAQGERVWEIAAPRCQDVWALPNGNVLFSYYTKKGGGVKEVSPDKTVVWEHKVKGAVHGCQRLPNGNTAIGECGACRVIIVSPEGEIVQETPLVMAVKNPHYHMRHIRVTEDGHILVCHPKESLVREYAPDGKVLREIRGIGEPFTAVRLANGNTLVGGGGKCIITEVDPAGRIVWQLKATDVPKMQLKWAAGVQRLPNGNTIVCNWLGHGEYGKGTPIFEVTKDKKVVWAFTDNEATRSVSSVAVLGEFPAIR